MFRAATLSRGQYFRLRGMVPALALVLAVSSFGCDELSARRQIQKGNRLYQQKKLPEAATAFQKALSTAPKLQTAQYNLALTQLEMGNLAESRDARKAYLKEALKNFESYLEMYPEDMGVEKWVVRLWEDTGSYDKAIAFWKKQLESNPTSTEAMREIAIYYAGSGDWEQSANWLTKEAAVAPTQDGSLDAFEKLAGVLLNRIRKSNNLFERRRMADMGVGAMDIALKKFPESIDILTYQVNFLHARGQASGAAWSMAIDRSVKTPLERQMLDKRKQKKRASIASVSASVSKQAISGTSHKGETSQL